MTHHNLVLELQLPLYFFFPKRVTKPTVSFAPYTLRWFKNCSQRGVESSRGEAKARRGERRARRGGGAPNISTCTPTVEEMESDKERGRRRPFLKLITAAETLQNTQGQSTHFFFQSRKKRELFKIISSSADSLFMHREPRKALIPSKKSHRLVFPPSFI